MPAVRGGRRPRLLLANRHPGERLTVGVVDYGSLLCSYLDRHLAVHQPLQASSWCAARRPLRSVRHALEADRQAHVGAIVHEMPLWAMVARPAPARSCAPTPAYMPSPSEAVERSSLLRPPILHCRMTLRAVILRSPWNDRRCAFLLAHFHVLPSSSCHTTGRKLVDHEWRKTTR